MEKFMQRENVYLGFGNSPRTSNSEDLDFNDVFGGPPRRFSMQEVRERYSFGETVESEEEAASSRWSGGLKEKPVFGDESVPGRRHQTDDFFDDIFKGSESYSSPRRTDRDRDRDRDSVLGSNPGSRIMSPARPLPPKADPFGTSLPVQFSLPDKLAKAMELPTFGSQNHAQYKVDRSTNGLKSPHSSSPLSRFSNQAIWGHDEIRNELHPVPRQSPLSYEASLISEDPSSTVISDQKDNIESLKKDTRNVDNIGNLFHFSIYKWAGRGVPMLLPLVMGNNSKSKDNRRYDKCANSNGRMESNSLSMWKQTLSTAELESLRTERVEEDLRCKDRKELQNSAAEALHEFPVSKSQTSPSDHVVLDSVKQNVMEKQVKPLDEIIAREKIEKEVPVKKTECLKSELKPLQAFLNEGDQPGNLAEMKERKIRTPEGVHADAHDNNVKEKEGIESDSNSQKVKKSSLKYATTNLGVNQGKSVTKGKVKEFVQIFSQEADSRPKADDVRRSRSTRWRNSGTDQKENEVSSNAAKAKGQVKSHNVDKEPDVTFKVDENLNNDEAQRCSPTNTSCYTSNHSSADRKKTFSSETLHVDSKISAEDSDDPLEDNFLVQELSDGHENVTTSENSEDTKAIDAKIRQWSVGKKGNIRSLLSTLQYVLWPESGWKPVPLVDLIEANSVKRAYQKALLRLHPDKLQQKGAAFHQKYIAQKVFDILQEAWDHFNNCSLTV